MSAGLCWGPALTHLGKAFENYEDSQAQETDDSSITAEQRVSRVGPSPNLCNSDLASVQGQKCPCGS